MKYQKFISFLEEYAQECLKNLYIENLKNPEIDLELQKERVGLEIAQTRNIINLLKQDPEKWKLYSDVFQDFKALSRYLELSPLRMNEKIDIIFYLIKRNTLSGMLEEEYSAVDSKDIESYQFKTFSEEEKVGLMYGNTLKKLFKEEATLTEKEEMQKEELIHFLEEREKNIDDFISLHKDIEKYYFEKQDCFDEEDVSVVVLALRELKVDSKLCDQIKYQLEKKIQKRKEKKVEVQYHFETIKKEKHYLTDKEYRNIRKELNTYFNFYQMEKIRDLTNEERLYCISLLLTIDAKESDIYTFLRRTKQEQMKMEEICTKLSFYGYDQFVLEMKQIEEEMKICDKSDYLFWKNELLQKLHQAKQILENSYEYEIMIAKELIKK